MLSFVEIENFKGIKHRQRVDFAPLTLLFGANSAGKSTILQALLYLHDLLERGTADVDRTELGERAVELGGFARTVHGHEMERAIVVRVGFATPAGLERFDRDLGEVPFADLEDEIDAAWLEVTIRLRATGPTRGAVLERAVIGVNDIAEPLLWLELGPSLRGGDPMYARVNLGHPLLASDERDFVGATQADGTPISSSHASAEVTEAWMSIAVPDEVLRSSTNSAEGIGASDPLADGSGFGDGRALPLFAVSRRRLSALPPIGESLRVIPFGDESPEKNAVAEQVRTFLEMIVLGTTAQLASFLRDTIYIGPLRAVPSRGFLYERSGRITSWADGLAAWEHLLSDRLDLVEKTNEWLRRLRTGCKVVVQQLSDSGADAEDIATGHVDKTVRRLLLETDDGSRVLPSEVGAGISQVMPIIVAALQRDARLTMVEQPEIHVHPAVQVGLGDLLIEAVTRDAPRGLFLVETHSEHVILRLLRRIRETTENELHDDAPPFNRDNLSVVYVESTPEGVRIRQLRVDENGEFIDRWPKGFFEERAEELF